MLNKIIALILIMFGLFLSAMIYDSALTATALEIIAVMFINLVFYALGFLLLVWDMPVDDVNKL